MEPQAYHTEIPIYILLADSICAQIICFFIGNVKRMDEQLVRPKQAGDTPLLSCQFSTHKGYYFLMQDKIS